MGSAREAFLESKHETVLHRPVEPAPLIGTHSNTLHPDRTANELLII
jgi:hypothetical protein